MNVRSKKKHMSDGISHALYTAFPECRQAFHVFTLYSLRAGRLFRGESDMRGLTGSKKAQEQKRLWEKR